jgi:hypothetical protein
VKKVVKRRVSRFYQRKMKKCLRNELFAIKMKKCLNMYIFYFKNRKNIRKMYFFVIFVGFFVGFDRFIPVPIARSLASSVESCQALLIIDF